MTTVVRLEKVGGPDVLTIRQVEQAPLGEHEAWVDHEAIGVNYLDVMQRKGTAPLALPSGLGLEAAGRVAAIGKGVTNVAVGDRVAYILGGPGAYASGRAYPAERLVRLPDALSSDAAASILFKGITAQYLIKTTYAVGPGTVVLLFGAAGALGQILGPWAKHLGASVIGVVSKEASVEIARSHGCDAVLIWGKDDLAKEVAKLSDGKGAHVVYDGLGRLTFAASLDSLRPRGLLASIGASTGSPPPLEIAALSKQSLYVTRPSLATHATATAEYQERAADVLAAIEKGVIKPSVWKSFPLEDVVAAHAALEQGKSAGAIVLKPR